MFIPYYKIHRLNTFHNIIYYPHINVLDPIYLLILKYLLQMNINKINHIQNSNNKLKFIFYLIYCIILYLSIFIYIQLIIIFNILF